jgi:hypothetical protein
MPRQVYAIDAGALRARFNSAGFQAKLAESGVFAERVKTMPADQSRGLPPNTWTVMTEYCTYAKGKRQVIAITHQYVQRVANPTRTWQPDPKLVVDGDNVYTLDPGE